MDRHHRSKARGGSLSGLRGRQTVAYSPQIDRGRANALCRAWRQTRRADDCPESQGIAAAPSASFRASDPAADWPFSRRLRLWCCLSRRRLTWFCWPGAGLVAGLAGRHRADLLLRLGGQRVVRRLSRRQHCRVALWRLRLAAAPPQSRRSVLCWRRAVRPAKCLGEIIAVGKAATLRDDIDGRVRRQQ